MNRKMLNYKYIYVYIITRSNHGLCDNFVKKPKTVSLEVLTENKHHRDKINRRCVCRGSFLHSSIINRRLKLKGV